MTQIDSALLNPTLDDGPLYTFPQQFPHQQPKIGIQYGGGNNPSLSVPLPPPVPTQPGQPPMGPYANSAMMMPPYSAPGGVPNRIPSPFRPEDYSNMPSPHNVMLDPTMMSAGGATYDPNSRMSPPHQLNTNSLPSMPPAMPQQQQQQYQDHSPTLPNFPSIPTTNPARNDHIQTGDDEGDLPDFDELTRRRLTADVSWMIASRGELVIVC